MSSPLRAVLLGIAVGVCAVPATYACGDKLVALGGGMSFERVFSSRHPGKLILFMRPDSALRAANSGLRLDTALERAGHSVRTVATRAELTQAMQDAATDLVVTDWVDARALNSEVGGRVAILPVRAGAEQLPTAGAGCLVDASRHKGRQVVHAVEQVLTRHGKGLPSSCSQAAGTATG
jgi:hypothetical protein